MPKARDMQERFWEKVTYEPNTGCWLWIAGLYTTGYGQFSLSSKQKSVRSHVLSWQLLRGEIPNGMHLDHTVCRIKSCVNPDHMVLRTPTDHTWQPDSAASMMRVKTHCPKGHEYNHENTYTRRFVSKNGKPQINRMCRQCGRDLYHRPDQKAKVAAKSKARYQAKKEMSLNG